MTDTARKPAANDKALGQDPSAEVEYFRDDIPSAVDHCTKLIIGIDPITRAILDFAAPPLNAKIADFGTGLGWLPVKLAALGYHDIVGVDLSPNRIQAARQLAERLGQKVDFRIATSEVLAADTYDLVLSICFLHHFEQLEYPLREIRRILKPGGRCFIYEPNGFWPFAGYKFDMRLNVRPGFGTENETLFSCRALERQVAQAGMKVDFLSTNWYSKRLTQFMRHTPIRHFGRSIIGVATKA